MVSGIYKVIFAILGLIVCQSVYAQTGFIGLNRDGAQWAGGIYRVDANGENYKSIFEFPVENPGITVETAPIKHSNGRYYGTTSQGGANGSGLLYEYDLSSNTYRKLVDFEGGFANTFNSSPMEANNGKLYGATAKRGSNNDGTLYEYDLMTNTFAVLHNFEAFVDGTNLKSQLIQAADGFLYGISGAGGLHGKGTLYRFNISTNEFTKLHDFGDGFGEFPNASVVQNEDGLFYGTTTWGGDNDTGTIYTFDPITKTYTEIYHFRSSQSSSRGVKKKLAATNGMLYGAFEEYTSSLFGFIFKIDPTDNTVSIVKNLDINTGSSVNGLTLGSDGRIYTIGVINKNRSVGGKLLTLDPVTEELEEVINFDSNMKPSAARLLEVSPNIFMSPALKQSAFEIMYRHNTVTKEVDSLFVFNKTPLGYFCSGSLLKFDEATYYGINERGGSDLGGVLYRYDATFNKVEHIHSFSFESGSSPVGTLIQHTNGKIYGINLRGGGSQSGAIFMFDPSTNEVAKVIDFERATTGIEPRSLLLAPNGKFYGLTSFGGKNDLGVLFEYDPEANLLSKKFDFADNAIGRNPRTLVIGPNNQLYGVAGDFVFIYNIATEKTQALIEMEYIADITVSNQQLYGITFLGGSERGFLFQYNLTTNELNILYNQNTINSSPSRITYTDNKLFVNVNQSTRSGEGKFYVFDLNANQVSTSKNLNGITGYHGVGKLVEYCLPPEGSNTDQSYQIPTNDTLSIVVEGSFIDTYVWKKDGVILPSQTGDTLFIPNVTLQDAGIYSVEISNECGTVSYTYQVSVANLFVEYNTSGISCFGGLDGNLQVTSITGGVAPYSYSLDGENFQTDAVFDQLSAQAYTLTIKDANGRTETISVIIETPEEMLLTVVTQDASCEAALDGSLTIESVRNGSSPYEYSLDGENFQTSNTFTELVAGAYEVTTRDASGCSVQEEVIISTKLTATISKSDASCFSGDDGSITVSNPVGGNAPYEYSIDGENFLLSNTFTGLETGVYEVITRDAGGCKYKEEVTLTAPEAISLSASITDSSDPKGNGGLSLVITGGTAPYEVVWDNEATGTSLTELSAGEYEATVTDAKGCEQVEKFIVGGVTSLEDLKQQGILIYPNPVEESFIINLQQVSKAQQVHIYTLKGRRVQSSDLKLGENRIEVTQWQSGLYLLRFDNGGIIQLLVE